ncbi:MAG TPA: hypothetical protein VGJ54_08960 [Streptosporangiaceae bacterium]
MKVPADPSADRLIREYLARVAEAGMHYLPMGRRGAFVEGTRRRIEREIGPGGTGDAVRVRDVLSRLGDPEDLVRAESARLDAERTKRQPGNRGAGGADPAGATAPLAVRPIKSRWRPGRDARITRWQPSAGQGDAGPQNRPVGQRGTPGEGKRKGRLGGLLLDRSGRRGAQPGDQAPQQGGPPSPAATVGQAPGGTAGQAPGTAGRAPGGTAGQAPHGTAGQPPAGPAGRDPRWFPWASEDAGPRASDRTVPLPSGRGTNQAPGGQRTQTPGEMSTRALEASGTVPPQREPANGVRPPTADASRAGSAAPSGGDTPAGGIPLPPHEVYTVRGLMAAVGSGAARLAVDAARLARQYPLESAAVTLLAIGGLILPFPYWLFGGLLGGILAIRSRIWNARDKWVALVGPAVVVLVGTVLAALITGGRGHAITAYPHAFHLYGGNLLRAGNALCAVYLALQARRGPQRRLPPWRR